MNTANIFVVKSFDDVIGVFDRKELAIDFAREYEMTVSDSGIYVLGFILNKQIFEFSRQEGEDIEHNK